jgi:hypothetical protein
LAIKTLQNYRIIKLGDGTSHQIRINDNLLNNKDHKLSIQTFWFDEGAKEWKPGKGIFLDYDLLPEIRDTLTKVIEEES